MVGMRRTRILCAIGGEPVVGCGCWQSGGCPRHTVRGAAGPREGRSVRDRHVHQGLPLGVRDGLQTLFGSQTLDIAEPAAEFQVTDVIVNPKLPIRRLVAAGCTIDYCLVYYERGGIAHTWHVALFHWTPAATRFEWGGTAPAAWRQSTTFGTPSCPG
jgi:hypothetical protein